MKRKIIGLILGLIILIAGWVVYRNYSPPASNVTNTTPSPTSIASAEGWLKYQSNHGFSIEIPSNWVVQEASSSSAKIWIAKDSNASTNSANFKQLAITLLEKADFVEALSSQEEFDEWYKSTPDQATKSGTVKIKSLTIGQYPAVIMRDLTRLSQQKNKTWSEVAWLRKDGRNYYLNYEGNGNWNNQLELEYQHMLDSFVLE